MKKLKALLLILLLLLLSQAGIAQPRTRRTPPPLKIYALDIGQGDSFLIVSPTGKNILVDTGDRGDDDTVLQALDNFAGNRRIDLFIASHAHADHIGSAAPILGASRVATVLDSGFFDTPPTTTYENYLQAVLDSGARHVTATPGRRIFIGGGAVITVLAPIRPHFTARDLHAEATTPNANSVVVRLDYGNFSMIFTGDAEAETEERLIRRGANLRAKVLKVGHHGARFATSEAFLRAVRPQAAIISVGARNNFGHPSPEALQRLRDARAQVYRTDLQGLITITSNGRSYRITTQRTASEADLFRGRRRQP
jgi:competence protein ComEC